jgi:23S rRNA C2498 (ribose-2'-O)-methylase RlmM
MNKQELKDFVFTEASKMYKSKNTPNNNSPLNTAIEKLKLLNESLSKAYKKLEVKINE